MLIQTNTQIILAVKSFLSQWFTIVEFNPSVIKNTEVLGD